MSTRKTPTVDLTKLQQGDRRTVLMSIECAELFYAVVSDIMPQIGGIVIQDYDGLNRGLILAEHLFGERGSELRKTRKAA